MKYHYADIQTNFGSIGVIMKIITILSLVVMLGLTACQRDTDNAQQDQTTTPHSMDKDE